MPFASRLQAENSLPLHRQLWTPRSSGILIVARLPLTPSQQLLQQETSLPHGIRLPASVPEAQQLRRSPVLWQVSSLRLLRPSTALFPQQEPTLQPLPPVSSLQPVSTHSG